MYRWLTSWVALAGLSSAVPVSAKVPVTLAPASKWNLHYAEGSCQLIRTFGETAQPLTMVFERISPDAPLSLLVFGGSFKTRPGTSGAKIAFLPFPALRENEGMVVETATDKKPALFFNRVHLMPDEEAKNKSRGDHARVDRDLAKEASRRAAETQMLAQVTGIELAEPSNRKTVLATGKLDRVAGMMRECAREQLVDYGIDPAVQDKIVRGAWSTKPLYTLFDWRDYPQEAVVKGEESVINARLNVGADGKVTRCTTLTRFQTPGFAEKVCAKLRQATFRPAELADGTKVPDFVTTSVRFRMP